jgi:2-polyprenyl-6-methoxyphenol hydroxylase-like FAD-dependent oxidoreductase
MSLQTRRAIGGSIAGLFVGAFLRRIGWRVDIYERSSIEIIGRGAGIFATHLELIEALDRCGAGTVDIGVLVYKRITFDRAGNVIAEKPQLQIVTSWDRLWQILLKGNDRQHYFLGHAFERVEQDGSGVTVRFAFAGSSHVPKAPATRKGKSVAGREGRATAGRRRFPNAVYFGRSSLVESPLNPSWR